MAGLSEKERIARLDSRAKEAENALQQLNGFVELLKKKSDEVSISTEVHELKAENEKLKEEVMRLKRQLILEEISNGVEQFPMPTHLSSTIGKNVQVVPPIQQPPPTGKVPPTKQKAPSEPENKKKTEKKVKGGAEPIDVSRLDLRVGKIMKAWKHPEADGLYVEEVDVGEEGKVRTICSGLVNSVPLEEMQERLGIFVCNLKTAKLKGVPSEGMIMCASAPDKHEILDPPPGSQPGDRVYCVGYEGDPDVLLNPKKKIFEKIKPDLHTNEECVACYKGSPFTVTGKGVCRSQTMKGAGLS